MPFGKIMHLLLLFVTHYVKIALLNFHSLELEVQLQTYACISHILHIPTDGPLSGSPSGS